MLLFTFNLGDYSAKIPRYGYAMTMPGIGYGLYLHDYDMVVIYYNIYCNYVMFMSHIVQVSILRLIRLN